MIQAARRPAKKPAQKPQEATAQAEGQEQSGPLLTTEEAAAILQIQPLTLVRWRHSRKGPKFLKIGASVRYRQADLNDWLKSREVETEQALV